MNDKELFTAFTDQLTRWSKSGVKPKLADFNTRTYLDLQQKRLEEKALKRSYSFELTSNVFKIGDSVIGQLLNGYNKIDGTHPFYRFGVRQYRKTVWRAVSNCISNQFFAMFMDFTCRFSNCRIRSGFHRLNRKQKTNYQTTY